MPSFQINENNTCWILAAGHAEPRHLNDLLMCFDSLVRLGVSEDDIYVFTDNPQANLEVGPYGITRLLPLEGLNSLSDHITQPYDHVGVLISGHGFERGIPVNSNPPQIVEPVKFLNSLKTIESVKGIFLVLCQCYAGVFNFLKTWSEGEDAPTIVCLGATNLNLSVSHKISIDRPIPPVSAEEESQEDNLEEGESPEDEEERKPLQSWVANIFLYNFVEWLKNPVDIDGDDVLSLMDGFKFAGVKTNEHLRKIRSELRFQVAEMENRQLGSLVSSHNILDFHRELLAIHLQLTNPAFAGQINPQGAQRGSQILGHLIQFHASQKILNSQLDLISNHQEPWILNANAARKFKFSGQIQGNETTN